MSQGRSLNLLGIWCWITKRHKWGRARTERYPDGAPISYKTCRRCHVIIEVKRRPRQAKETV